MREVEQVLLCKKKPRNRQVMEQIEARDKKN